MQELTIRPVEPKDVGTLLKLIMELAEYEKMVDDVVTDEMTLYRALFEQQAAQAALAELDGEAVGYQVFFYNFSTFAGRRGLYLEDIYVRPSLRGRGYGKAMFRYLAALALERGCARFEWTCLDWNASSIGFYTSLGAKPMQEWTIYRLDEDGMRGLIEK